MEPSSVMRLLVVRLRWVFVVQLATVVVSTVGFVVLADLKWFDALYMSVITLGTVGYGEVGALDNIGRVWAMVVIAGGFAVLVYSGAMLTSLLLSGDLQAAMNRRRSAKLRERLEDHLIVVGFGRVGRSVIQASLRAGTSCVVVDADDAKAAAIRRTGAMAVIGDGMQEQILQEAAIGRARALIAAAPDDPVNLVVTLTARALRPDLRIVSRVNNSDWQQRLLRAGASAAVSPYGDFGAGLAASALGTDLVETHALSGYGLRTEEIIVGPGSGLIGRLPSHLVENLPNTTLLAMRRIGPGTPWEHVDSEVAEGDLLVILGPDTDADALGENLR